MPQKADDLLRYYSSCMPDLGEAIINWYINNGRQFYWRSNPLDGWGWLFLEMLLRKTRAETVNSVYPGLLLKYSCPQRVMMVESELLEADMFYLGLYRQRVEALKKVAKSLCENYGGRVPDDIEDLTGLPHVGPYIASAVACFCYGKPVAIVDINVARVLTRVGGIQDPGAAKTKWLRCAAQQLLPENKWVEYNYGLLDIGAAYCRKRKPKCEACPLGVYCAYNAQNNASNAV